MTPEATHVPGLGPKPVSDERNVFVAKNIYKPNINYFVDRVWPSYKLLKAIRLSPQAFKKCWIMKILQTIKYPMMGPTEN